MKSDKKKTKTKTKKTSFKKIIDTIQYTIIIFLFLIIGGVILSKFNTPLGFRLFSVLSGSMEPAISKGSLILVRPVDKYQTGDIITFRGEGDSKETVTHRIINVVEDKDNNKFGYETKGDANEDPDPELIARRRVIGKVMVKFPWLGHPVAFAQTQEGLLILIIVPGIFIIYSEVMNIKTEVKKLIKKRKSNKKEEKEEDEDKD